MRGQTETIALTMLFFVGVILFISAFVWGRSALDRNLDLVKAESAKDLALNIDKGVQDTIKFGGKNRIDFDIDATVELMDSKTIEFRMPTTVDIPNYWVNITSDGSLIREMKEGNTLRIQIVYQFEDFDVELYTEGPETATPKFIDIEKVTTTKINNRTLIRIKLTLQ